jgi:heptosyltransferase-3
MGTYVVARTDRIGDLMLSLPVAEAIKTIQPEARVIYVVSPQTSELAAACPFVDSVIQYDESGRDPGEFFRLLSRLRQLRADTALILRPVFMVGLACLFAGIPRRVGTAYRFCSPLFNRRVKEHRKFADKHELDYNLNILRAVDEVQDRRYVPRIEVTETCREYGPGASQRGAC